jgi:transposase-like protein
MSEGPVCPKCGCGHAPMKDYRMRTRRDGKFGGFAVRHRCRYCGREFTEWLTPEQAMLRGIPEMEVET